MEKYGLDVHKWNKVSVTICTNTVPRSKCRVVYVRTFIYFFMVQHKFQSLLFSVKTNMCIILDIFLVSELSPCFIQSQHGNFNTIMLAARKNRIFMFHHLVSKYNCNARQREIGPKVLASVSGICKVTASCLCHVTVM